MEKTDKTVDVLRVLAGLGESGKPDTGLRVVTVQTAEPDAVTLNLAGVDRALDTDLFEIPTEFYPLRAGDKLLAFPIVTNEGGRWGMLAKLTGGLVLGTMTSSTACRPDGMSAVYPVAVPTYLQTATADAPQLQSGDRVSLRPYWDGAAVSYYVENRY